MSLVLQVFGHKLKYSTQVCVMMMMGLDEK